MKYIIFLFSIFAAEYSAYNIQPTVLSKDEMLILNSVAEKVELALQTATQLASQGTVVSNDLTSANSQQIIKYNNSGSDNFPHIKYLAITSDYCVVLRFNDYYDYNKYNSKLKHTFAGSSIFTGFYRNNAPSSNKEAPTKMYPRLLGAQIVWIPTVKPITPSSPTTGMFTASGTSKISLPTGNIIIPSFVAFSSIGQEIMPYYFYAQKTAAGDADNSLVTSLTTGSVGGTLINNSNTGFAISSSNANVCSPRVELNWSFLNKADPYKYNGSYTSLTDVPDSIIYNNIDIPLANIFYTYKVKWMPASEFNYSQYIGFQTGATANGIAEVSSVLTAKSLRSYFKEPSLTGSYLIAYRYLLASNYFNNFYSWNPKNLDDMFQSTWSTATPTALTDIYPIA